MFASIVLTITALFTCVAAAPGGPVSASPADPVPAPPAAPASSACNSGALACCNNYQDSNSISQVEQFSIMSQVRLSALTGQVGTACSPSVIDGTSGSVSCTQQTASCDHVSANGAFAAGCSPLIL